MADVDIYLNFPGNAEEALHFYRSVFGGDFAGGGIMRFSDMPPQEGMPPLPERCRNMVMHASLPILGGVFTLMASDAPEEMGFHVQFGNHAYINLSPDTREETRRLFNALSEGGQIEQELQDMFWGDYYGACVDKFGVRWMFNCAEKA